MPGQCGCGTEVRNSFDRFGCLACGAACCPSCAISLESAGYCPSCAADLLGTGSVRAGTPFELR